MNPTVKPTAWKTDNYKFVGKAFDYSYAQRLNKLAPILGERSTTSIDYELTGSGGYGELQEYDGNNLNFVSQKRGFKTIVTPKEYTSSVALGRKDVINDKSGECRKAGSKLGNAAASTVYLHVLRCLGNAFDTTETYLGGDGKPWAAADHPVASKGSDGRKYTPDTDAGTYSNLLTSALSVSAITDAQSKANRLVTPDGLPFLCEYDTLLVSPELEATAKKICGEDARLDPESANHGANPVHGMRYIVIGGGTDGFTAKQWAVCDRRLMKELFNLIYTVKPEVLNSELDNPLKDMYTAYTVFGAGWGDARQIMFSNPT